MTSKLRKILPSGLLLFIVILFSNHCANIAAADIVFDFETGDLQGWTVVEGYFDYIISDRVYHHNVPTQKYNKHGTYYLSTVEQKPGLPSNDTMMGIVESPVFVLSAPELSFWMSGGKRENAYIAIYTLDGTECRRYHAEETENLILITDSVPELVGKPIYLRAVDHETAPWGFVAMDDFRAQGEIDTERTAQRLKTHLCSQMKAETDKLSRELEILIKEADDYEVNITEFLENIQAGIEKQRNLLQKPITEFSSETFEKIQQENAGFWACALEQIQQERRKIGASFFETIHEPILYVTRFPYRSDYHAIDTLFNSDEFNYPRFIPHKDLFTPGSSLKLWDVKSNRELVLIDTPEGVVRDPDIDFDADRIVLSIRNDRETDYQIWEVTLNGATSFADLLNNPESLALSRDQYERVPETEIFHHPGIHLKRLTNALCVADFDPVYLPDGTIVFASTRDPKYNMCSRDIAADLFRMNGDGSNIYQITKSTLFEHNPTLLPDGRICYHRWEYVDRNFGDAHALWTVSPDGLNQSVYWGNNTAVPGGIYNPNFIEETGEMLCIFGPHHALENGALAIIDRRLGIDGPDPVVQTWPESFKQLVRDTGGFDCDTSVTQVPLKFEDPLVLDESHFLVSRMIVPNGKTGLYLVDRNYHEFLLREEPTERGIYDSRLVRPRKKPFIVKGNRDFENNDGTFYVSNVYIGTHMKSVKPGSARYLRVVQSPEKRNFSWGSWEGQGYTAPGMNWHSLENKKILGTVRIEEDGSTAFKVPCDKFVYFQLLDEKGKMLQTMRSGTVLQSGEKTSCIGCHENRLETTANSTAEQITVAMTKEPQSLTLRPGEPGSEFSYMRDIQPIFDKHCVECHDYGKPAGEKLNLAPDRDLVFNTSYVNLWNSSYIRCIGAGPAELQESLTWGSNVSPLIQEIENPRVKEHIDVKLNEKLTAEEMTRLCTWIDLNGVYYPCYESAWPDSNSGRTPYSRAELEELGGYLGVTFDYARIGFAHWHIPEVCFERPWLSPSLVRLIGILQEENPGLSVEEAQKTERYQKAVAMIQLGAKRLQERPRADMPGFIPCEKDQERLRKYEFRRQEELRFRQAIQKGEKTWDSPGKGW